jgi:regulator of protease activity HflC (stomatin/prohibitin superfamily)
MKLSNDIEVTSNSPDDSRTTRTWGYIAAYPHEYLIHFRNGKLNTKTSGQGARCYKRLSDTVFIIPTSLKEIIFEANQLSADNVDIRIRGMAIYRIKDPLRIYTQLNFSNRQQAEIKLARMIGDLCRSTAKWLVANMQLEECLRKRKEDIAESLKREVSLVVSDPDKGWGVEIGTIDIQDIYIQDDEIFRAMQTLFKTEKLRESELSQLAMKKDLEVRRLQQELELSEHRKNHELEKARIQAEIKAEELRLMQDNDKAQYLLTHYRAEQEESLSRRKAEQEVQKRRQDMEIQAEERRKNVELQGEEQQAVVKAQRLTHELEIESTRQKLEIELDSLRQRSEVEIDTLRQRTEVENNATPLSLEKNFIDSALPAIAGAMAKSMSNSRINIIQGDGQNSSPVRFILNELLSILQDRLDKVRPTD